MLLKEFCKYCYFKARNYLGLTCAYLLKLFGILVILKNHDLLAANIFNRYIWLIILPYGLDGFTIFTKFYFFSFGHKKLFKRDITTLIKEIERQVSNSDKEIFIPTSFIEYRIFDETDFGFQYVPTYNVDKISFTHCINYSHEKPILYIPPITGFFHIFLEYLPEIIVACEKFSIYLTIPSNDSSLEIFKYYGLFPANTHNSNFPSSLFKLKEIFTLQSKFPSLVTKQAISTLNNFPKDSNQNLSTIRNILISRKGNQNGRILINETEILDKLSCHNFKLIDPGNLSFRDQVELFRNARVVVGSHGAALSHIVSLKSKSTLIELNQKTYVKWHYNKLARDLNINYKLILGEKFSDSEFYIDPNLLFDEVQKFMS